MARKIDQLTQKFVDEVTAPCKLTDGNGLRLVVAHAASKSWVFGTRQLGGFEIGLGSALAVKLATARKLTAEINQMLALGKDPREERKRDKASKVTFGQCQDALIESLRSGWKNGKGKSSEQQWKSTLDTYAGVLRHKSVSTIDTSAVVDILKPIWTDKGPTAERLRGRIERVLDYAKASRYRSGENPARWKGNLDHILGKVKRTVVNFEALPYQDVPALVSELRNREGFDARALELTILTCVRSSEAIEATWPEIDLDGGVWTIPAGRMKGASEHQVPLSSAALNLLRALPRVDGNPYLFPGSYRNRPIGNSAMLKLLRAMGRKGITGHGFRSSFRDWAGNETSFPREIAEEVLSHVVGDATERAYRRQAALGRRRKLLDAWTAFVVGSKGKVIPIGKTKAA